MDKLGLYIHVPFCKRKCPYCDFYSLVENETLKQEYVDSICKAIKFYSKNEVVDTVYFGGGTPSLLNPHEIDKILQTIVQHYRLENPEITMECNPSSVKFKTLQGYRAAEVNRLSFGIQSLDDSELAVLGRLHDAAGAIQAVQAAQKAGFDNLSGDLMLGISQQTSASLSRTIALLDELDIQHISAYMLSIEDGTPYAKRQDALQLPDEDTVTALYTQACEELAIRGFEQYEISNFAKPGFESRHNSRYWKLEPYLGLGPSAHSLFRGKRCYFARDLQSFLQQARENRFVMQTEGDFDPAEEYVMLSLRLAEGLSLQKAAAYGIDTEKLLKNAKRYMDAALLKHDGDQLALTREGFLLSNRIISDLLP